MPNTRRSAPGQVETAWPWKAGRFAEAEPQDARGEPGSRDIGPLARPREMHGSEVYTGVNPLPPIDPAMPNLHPGDQGG